MADILQVSGLNVAASVGHKQEVTIIDDVNFSVARGEVLALIGESGSGKTTIALALMGYARKGCRIVSGSIQVGSADVLNLNKQDLTSMRGRQVSYVAQSAAASFNPSKSIMNQITESALIHGLMSRSEAEAKAVELFRALTLPDPQHIGSRYPHQVSGGQLQRLMAAMAMINEPEVVIFDEPTTALDVTTQIDVLRAFKQVIKDRNTTAIYVSHDLAVVSQVADKIVVLNGGKVFENGTTDQILNSPQNAYTQTLIGCADPQPNTAGSGEDNNDQAAPPLLKISGMLAGYGRADKHGMPSIPVLSDIDLEISRGTSLGVIGESGSGKSTIARVIAGLLAPARGRVELDGEPMAPGLSNRTRDQFRRIQIVFQNADTALNPAHSVARILGRPLTFYRGLRGAELSERVAELLELVQLPAELATRRCSELSGGQKQRINLARALAAEPDLILCDEVTSALDTVVKASILELMDELRRKLNVAYMFISHDISTVMSVCDDIMVLYGGRRVELANWENLYSQPFHPYTDLLTSSVPELRPGWLEDAPARPNLPALSPQPDSVNLCNFLPRCSSRIDGVCNVTPPPDVRVESGKTIKCHLCSS